MAILGQRWEMALQVTFCKQTSGAAVRPGGSRTEQFLLAVPHAALRKGGVPVEELAASATFEGKIRWHQSAQTGHGNKVYRITNSDAFELNVDRGSSLYKAVLKMYEENPAVFSECCIADAQVRVDARVSGFHMTVDIDERGPVFHMG